MTTARETEDGPEPQHRRPPGASDLDVQAAGTMTEALETRGRPGHEAQP